MRCALSLSVTDVDDASRASGSDRSLNTFVGRGDKTTSTRMVMTRGGGEREPYARFDLQCPRALSCSVTAQRAKGNCFTLRPSTLFNKKIPPLIIVSQGISVLPPLFRSQLGRAIRRQVKDAAVDQGVGPCATLLSVYLQLGLNAGSFDL